MGSWLIHLLQNNGLLIVFLAMTAENAMLPIPSEIVIPYGGVLAAQGHTTLWAVILVSTAAALLGAGIVYAIGRFGGRPLAVRYGYVLRLKPSHMDRAEKWFEKRGEAMVLVTRVLPVVRTFISLPAGFARMSWKRFFLYTGLGSLVWNTALAYLGWAFGANWDALQADFGRYTIVAGIVIAVAVVALVGWGVWRWHRKVRLRGQEISTDGQDPTSDV
ncbi:MAG TPA: DedA family protein [Thermoleophilia bacterium]